MARHRSPKGRRAHLGPPLTAVAAAGVGGAHRSIPVSQLVSSQLFSSQLFSSQLFSSLPVRFVATAVAGGALAAVGQHALVENLPATTDGTNVLRLGVQEFFGSEPVAPVSAASALVATSAVAEPLVTLAPVVTTPELPAEPDVIDARELVKATDLQRHAADAGSRTAAKQVRAAEAAAARAAQAEAAREADQAKAAAEGAAEGKAEKAGDDEAAEDTQSGQQESAGAAGATAAAGEAAAATGKDEVDTSSLAGGSIQMVTGRVTSGFGARWGVRHEGLDIAAPIGTPIKVPIAGTVVDSGPASGFGLWVRVQHADGTVTTYGHVNRFFVTKGEQVEAGQEIAEVGNRGHSTGPHLHIEVTTPAGSKINPRPWLDQHDIGY